MILRVNKAKHHVSSLRVWFHFDDSQHKADPCFIVLQGLVDTLFLFFFPFGIPATGAGPHQPVHLQSASVDGRAGVGEHAEASGSRDLHEDTEGCQRGQQRSWLCKVCNWTNEMRMSMTSLIFQLLITTEVSSHYTPP